MQKETKGAFEAEIEAFERADRSNPPPANAVLFLGSSTIRLWAWLQEDFPSTEIINRGFGGSTIQDSIRYASRIVIPYKPRLIVFYAGDNDLACGRTPEQVFTDFKGLVDVIRQDLPSTRIAFVSIKPSPSRASLMGDIRKANELIRRYTSQDSRLSYLNVFDAMLKPDGTPREDLFIEDNLHMNARGYALWREILAPVVGQE